VLLLIPFTRLIISRINVGLFTHALKLKIGETFATQMFW